MSETIIQCQPAFVLRQQQYRETSLIVDLFTQDYGRLSVLAKGVRKAKSRDLALLQPFLLINVSFIGRTELKTMSGVEVTGRPNELTGIALYCGYYLNELLYRFLPKFDPHPEIFQDYKECLAKLSKSAELDVSLRIFELNLMEKIGYGIQLGYDSKNKATVDVTKKYMFDSEHGLTEHSEGLISGQTLLAMQQHNFSDPMVRKEAKRLMRMVIDSHLDGQEFKSRNVINSLIKRL